MITDWAPEGLLVEIRAADAAARAARLVPGVVRLQPGVLGLLGRFAAQAWEQATGEELPDVSGVNADRIDDTRIRIAVQIVVDGGYHAGAVGAAVRRATAAAVAAELPGVTGEVAVRIVEIDLSVDRV